MTETAVAKTTKALTGEQRKAQTIFNMLMSRRDGIQNLLPRHLTAEKLVRGFMAAATRNPRLLECTPLSVLNTVLIAASLGLEVGRPRGGVHPVPFRNRKNGTTECTPIPDYRGLMDLAYRSGQVLSIEARAVYDGDKFDFAYGTASHITHVPALPRAGDVRCVYSVAHVKDGRPVFMVMSREEVEEHRARSRAKDDGPWVTDWTAMALKTVVKSLANWLPQASEQFTKAAEMEDRLDRGEGIADLFDVIESQAEDLGSADAPEPTATAKIAAKLSAKAQEETQSPLTVVTFKIELQKLVEAGDHNAMWTYWLAVREAIQGLCLTQDEWVNVCKTVHAAAELLGKKVEHVSEGMTTWKQRHGKAQA